MPEGHGRPDRREDIAVQPDDAFGAHRIREETIENAWRRDAVSRLLAVFYTLNGSVLLFILLAWAGQTFLQSAPHMMSERTLWALIAGSTTQLGALAVFVGRSLAPARPVPSPGAIRTRD